MQTVEDGIDEWEAQLYHVLYGRRLLQSETGYSATVLKKGVDEGVLRQIPGIEKQQSKLRCNGCGNINQKLFGSHACYQCQKKVCYYCRNCIRVRKISSCMPLYVWTNSYPNVIKSDRAFNLQAVNPLKWEGKLTPLQESVSEEMIQQIQNKKDILVHAVTGSGKTEMMFQPIAYALWEGGRVCFASPRMDVILEIAPRLKHVFPDIEMGVYFGDSEEKNPQAQLILATTHQLMRFHQSFDVLILDESDAFPYQGDPALKFSLQQALKLEHSLIYCTATPEPTLLKELGKVDAKVVFVPCRFHGRPLEIPVFIWIGKWKEKLAARKVAGKLIKKLHEQLAKGRQIFIFVPYVEVAKQLHGILEKALISSDYVYAEDIRRREKVKMFRDRMVDVLVTTTILERGVTVPFVDVFVFGSESKIFDAAALVQICGRAGRHMDDEVAKIYFFHEGVTTEMRRAKREIIEMNRRAKR